MKKFLCVLLCALMTVALSACESGISEQNANDSQMVDVLLTVSCEENLMFSKYDLSIVVDEISQGTLSHGQSTTLNLSLSTGTHTLKIHKISDRNISGEYRFVVNQSVKYAFKASCYSSSVSIACVEDGVAMPSTSNTSKGASTTPPQVNTTSVPSDNTTLESTTTTQEKKDEIALPFSSSSSYSDTVDTITAKFKNAGFTNVKTTAVYDVGTGFFAKLSLGTITNITVDNQSNFVGGTFHKKNTPIVITYREYEFKNPNIEYTSYTVAELIKDAEKNELNAEEKYEGKCVAITGRVDSIDDSGDFALYPSNDPYAFIGVSCDLLIDEQKSEVRKLSTGDVITVKGKITYVSDLLGYSMDVYKIK